MLYLENFLKHIKEWKMTAKTVDTLALDPNSNLEGDIRCFRLAIGRVL